MHIGADALPKAQFTRGPYHRRQEAGIQKYELQSERIHFRVITIAIAHICSIPCCPR